MKFFIKKLGSNESGYSGDIPNQRGKFILIPKSCYEFFPEHSSKYLNDITLINFITPNGNIIPRKYDWHNAKYHVDSRPDLNRDHDEKSLYRSKALDDDLGLDRYVFFICTKLKDEDKYFCFSVKERDEIYEYLNEKYRTAKVTQDDVLLRVFEELFNSKINQNEQTIIEDDIIETLKDDDEKTIKKDLILSESMFREFVMKTYDFKCCVREESITFGDKIILQAAHIKPKRDPFYGPNIPSNGLALSYDLHRMFDEGMWTLTDELRVMVHPKIRNQDLLNQYHDKKIAPRIEGAFFRPDSDYIQFHRNHEFGKFDTSR